MQFCIEEQIDPFHPSPNETIEFLHRLFMSGKADDTGLAYSSLGTARSALSAIATIDNVPAGQHPLVCKFMKAVFNQRPALPRNTITWDIALVLDHIKSMLPSEQLHIHQLSQKLVVLMLILSGQRGQTIHMLDTADMTMTQDYVSFRVHSLLKTSRPGHHATELSFPSYPIDSKLCVVQTLRTYLSKTKPFRNNETRLFIATKPPYAAVSRDTIRRWTKQIMVASGIDMNVFTPHSTRSASTSKAASKLSLETILKTAGWSQPSTFQTYYNKPIRPQHSFAEAVLQTDS